MGRYSLMPWRRGFTIVELLVVVGILALLIGLLMPVLRQAREAANRTACISNLRQITMAFLLYAHDNNGWLPQPAMRASTRFYEPKLDPQPEDWLYWQGGRDFSQGRLASYLGGRVDVLRCPSDADYDRREYKYSYAVNYLFTGLRKNAAWGSGDWIREPCRLNKVAHPADKILVVDENPETIDDGGWRPEYYLTSDGNFVYYISNRHDSGQRHENTNAPAGWTAGRGNVACADGHCAFIDRWEAHQGSRCNPSR